MFVPAVSAQQDQLALEMDEEVCLDLYNMFLMSVVCGLLREILGTLTS